MKIKVSLNDVIVDMENLPKGKLTNADLERITLAVVEKIKEQGSTTLKNLAVVSEETLNKSDLFVGKLVKVDNKGEMVEAVISKVNAKTANVTINEGRYRFGLGSILKPTEEISTENLKLSNVVHFGDNFYKFIEGDIVDLRINTNEDYQKAIYLKELKGGYNFALVTKNRENAKRITVPKKLLPIHIKTK